MSAQSADRFASTDKIISILQVEIQASDRGISRLTDRLDESRAQQISIHGIAPSYYHQLLETTMAMCNVGDLALSAARGLINDHL